MLVYVLIVANRGLVDHIVGKISEIAGEDAKSVHVLYGEFDIIAKLQAQSEEKMVQRIKEIKNIEGVQSIKTYTVAHKTKESDVLPKD